MNNNTWPQQYSSARNLTPQNNNTANSQNNYIQQHNANNANSNANNFSGVNPHYRQPLSYNPSPTSQTLPPGQLHEGPRKDAPSPSGRDVYQNRNNMSSLLDVRATQEQQSQSGQSVNPSNTASSTTNNAPARTQSVASSTNTSSNNNGKQSERQTTQRGGNTLPPIPIPISQRTAAASAHVPSTAPAPAPTPAPAPAPQPYRPPPIDIKPLYTRLEQLNKSQNDILSYLRGELDRRKAWEETLLQEMNSRHAMLIALITSAGAHAAHAPNLGQSSKRVGLPDLPEPLPDFSAPTQQLDSMSQFDYAEAYHNPMVTPVAPQSTRTVNRNVSISKPTSTGDTAEASTRKVSASASKKRGREDEDDIDGGRDANVEVDDNGIIYMTGGRRLGVVPAKIQSLVRKSLYASQGVPMGKVQLPLYSETMDPPGDFPDNNPQWQFGNLRFDWNLTTRKSPQNVEMKQIVIDHILSHRYAYPDIPDTEFTPERLDHSYEQSFNHWKAKFNGKKASGQKKVKSVEHADEAGKDGDAPGTSAMGGDQADQNGQNGQNGQSGQSVELSNLANAAANSLPA